MMQSDDVYRARRNLTIAELSAWTGFVADVAHVEYGPVDGAWRIQITPHVRSGCPVELLLRDDQKFDIRLASETYEDREIENLDMFLPLLKAVVDGLVITRTLQSALTGTVRGKETFVRFAGGSVFQASAEHSSDGARPPPLPGSTAEVEVRDTHYVPYRRETLSRAS